MKLIIAGATGLVGKEITRQSLQHENITPVVALSRGKFELDAITGGGGKLDLHKYQGGGVGNLSNVF